MSDFNFPSSTSSILLFGSTGFIGGCYLNSLLKSPIQPSTPTDVYLRILTSSSSKAETIRTYCQQHLSDKSLKIEVIPIPRDGKDLWYSESERLSSLSHTVLQIATSDDLRLTKAINSGLSSQSRPSSLPSPGNLIHLSGVQLIESKPIGEFVDVHQYDDSDWKALDEIPDEAAHRFIDLEIENQRREGKIMADIVCPALVWGKGVGPGERVSGLLPSMVSKSIYNSQAVYCGKGDNVWCAIHIDDLISLLRNLLERHFSTSTKKPSSSEHWSTFYLATHPLHVDFKHMSTQIGKQLLASKVLNASQSEPKSVPVPYFDPSQKGVRIEDEDRASGNGVSEEEKEKRIQEEKVAPAWPCRTNCKATATRAERDFGWKAEVAFDDEAIMKDTKDCLDVWSEEDGGWESFKA